MVSWSGEGKLKTCVRLYFLGLGGTGVLQRSISLLAFIASFHTFNSTHLFTIYMQMSGRWLNLMIIDLLRLYFIDLFTSRLCLLMSKSS